ncbi:MAG TPA: methyltransferase domain-containing protein [Bryobacteraceae bacterium]|nr:methyltransferase domain-containing protein [Bryobacteraceae bacterium]
MTLDPAKILELASATGYDFRTSANPADPSKHLFSEWLPYYRMKWAIARALQPKRILEIGVRFGYSAAAFLDACPDAEYLGIDNDSETFGGVAGAVEWARRITTGRKANFLVADSQQLQEFPGGPYDLIHVDGQQDENGTIGDLRKALRQTRHILVDGFFWTRNNFLHVSDFLYCYRAAIESCLILPGYAGELLITLLPAAEAPSRVSNSGEIRSAYTASYYLQDCGGFEAYKRDKGLSLSDWRLRTVADLAELSPIGLALDLGCGRGELSAHLLRLGHDVTAVDYSEAAIELARAAAPAVHFHAADVNDAKLSGQYDVMIASDLIEHLTAGELDRLYARLAAHLSPQGLFVLHTFPNVWYYEYEYRRRRREARKIDAYLPLEPRSRYEQLMHINEQSPRVLRRQLREHFPHVVLWFAAHDLANPFENLERRFSIAEMRSAGDLFAVASHAPISAGWLRERLAMPRVTPPIDVRIELLEMPGAVRRNSRFQARVRLTNNSAVDLKSRPPHPVHLSYHCYSEERQVVAYDGIRSVIPTLKAGSTEDVEMQLSAPATPGRYLFRVTLVQEWVMWFDEPPQNAFVETWAEIT